MLVLSSQARLLGSNPVVWLCDQEPVHSFQKGPPREKAKLRRWWTYLSQLRLTVHHIQGVKNECADYISRNSFDALIGARSEALAKEAFSRMDVHLDLNMTMIRPLDGLQQSEYLKEFGDIYKRLEKRLELLLVNQDQWKRDKSYLWHEDRIMVPSDRVPALLKWTHESSGHVGADRTLRLFRQWFHTTWTDDQLRKTLQPIVDKCLCRSCKPGDIRDRGLYSTLPIPHCANSVLYVDYTEMPKFRGYDFALLVTCGLTRVFPCTKHITGEETIKILLEEWFCVYGAPKEINSDEDVRVRSQFGWYKRVLRSLNVQVSTGIPYSHTSNPLCERQIRVLKENVRIWCKTKRIRDRVRLLPVISLMMNSQESSATGYLPHELFLGRPAWFLHAPHPEDTHSSVGEFCFGKKHHVRPPRPTVRPRPTQRVRRGWAGRAGRQRGTEGQGGESERRGTEPPPPPTCAHPAAAHRATAGRQQGPPWSQTGPPERGCVPAPAQQHARARSARHTQAKQGTRAAPHASTHHGTKHDTTTANTHTRRRTSRQEQVQAPQSPQRDSRRPDGRVCARQ